MTEPKKFSKGKHSYTKWGPRFKIVHVEGKKKEIPGSPGPSPLSVDVDAQTELGVYSNMSMAHHSDEEVILDFCYMPPGQPKGRVRSRVILSHPHVDQLILLLQKAKGETLPHNPEAI